MKHRTLAPAVLASLTAAGLVLAPVTASAQEADAPNTLAVEDASALTADDTTAEESATQAAEAPKESPSPQEPKNDAETGSTDDDSTKSAEEPPSDDAEKPEDDKGDEPAPENEEGEESDEDETEAAAVDATVEVAPTVDLSQVVQVADEHPADGAPISVSGLDPEGTYTLEVSGGAEGTTSAPLTDSAEGTAEQLYRLTTDDAENLAQLAGPRTVTVKDEAGESVGTASFTIVDDMTEEDDEAPAEDPTLVVQDSIPVEDLMVPQGEDPGDRGLPLAATGLTPGESYTFSVIAPKGSEGLSTTFQAVADENGNATGSYYIEWYGDYSAATIAGTYGVELLDADLEVLDSTTVEFTAGSTDDGSDDQDDSDDGQAGEDDSDDSAVAASLQVSPQTLTAAAFMDFDRGVQVTALDCAPGESVSLEVLWPGTEDVAYADGIEADEDGTAAFSFYGTGDRASDYVGTWTVNVTCGDDTMTDTFTVTGASGDDGQNGSELPRTGVEAGALGIIAAGLLTVGAATVMISSRPRRRDSLA